MSVYFPRPPCSFAVCSSHRLPFCCCCCCCCCCVICCCVLEDGQSTSFLEASNGMFLPPIGNKHLHPVFARPTPLQKTVISHIFLPHTPPRTFHCLLPSFSTLAFFTQGCSVWATTGHFPPPPTHTQHAPAQLLCITKHSSWVLLLPPSTHQRILPRGSERSGTATRALVFVPPPDQSPPQRPISSSPPLLSARSAAGLGCSCGTVHAPSASCVLAGPQDGRVERHVPHAGAR